MISIEMSTAQATEVASATGATASHSLGVERSQEMSVQQNGDKPKTDQEVFDMAIASGMSKEEAEAFVAEYQSEGERLVKLTVMVQMLQEIMQQAFLL